MIHNIINQCNKCYVLYGTKINNFLLKYYTFNAPNIFKILKEKLFDFSQNPKKNLFMLIADFKNLLPKKEEIKPRLFLQQLDWNIWKKYFEYYFLFFSKTLKFKKHPPIVLYRVVRIPNHHLLFLNYKVVTPAIKQKFNVADPLLFSIFNFFKKTILSLVFSIFSIFFFFYTFQISFLKFVAGWLIFGLIAYWLISGFNFFLKKYRFSKFTTAIQRFWKRTLTIFWINEAFLFALFCYYTLNASQEPVFMYDQASLYKFQLLQPDNFILTSLYVVIVLNVIMLTLIKIKTSTFRQLSPFFFFISLVLLLLLYNESYQFYYVVNFYDDSFWVFSEDDNLWELEHDSPRTRTRNHYLSMLILLKFWHYIFIFGSWVFFLMKTFEQQRVRYALFSMNYQNLIIFYLMSWSVMYTWLKFCYRRFFDKVYFWFFVNNRVYYSTVVYQDLIQYFKSFNFFFKLKNHYKMHTPFFNFKDVTLLIYTRGDLLKNYTLPFLN